MNETWQWFLVVGGGIIFFVGVIRAVFELVDWLRNGKKNTDSYFREKARRVFKEFIVDEHDIQNEARKDAFSIIQTSLDKGFDQMDKRLDKIEHKIGLLTLTELDSLKNEIRNIYHEEFKPNGMLPAHRKTHLDKICSHYKSLGGNGDIDAIYKEICRVYETIMLDIYKETHGKQKGKKKPVEETV